MTTTVLLTGATGYIASHTWLALQQAGYRVVGVDNFVNSSPVVLERLAELSSAAIEFERADVCDAAAMDAKANCPVSAALRAVPISLVEATLAP